MRAIKRMTLYPIVFSGSYGGNSPVENIFTHENDVYDDTSENDLDCRL